MNPFQKKRNGFVLVSVLWILAILTVVSLGFARRAMLERQMAWYSLDREQAQHMARGAVERALFELANKALLDEYNNQTGYTGLDQRWAFQVDLFDESTYFNEPAAGDFAEDRCSYVIEDCERRISINSAPRAILEELEVFGFRTIDEMLARREVESRGYQPRLFRSIEELRTLQEIRAEAWYGRDDGVGLREMLTVYGDAAGLLNVNTASREVLLAIPRVDRNVVEAIIEFRAGRDGVLYTRDDRSFESLNRIAQRLDISSEKLTPIRKYCKTDSQYFIIKAHATRRRGKINAYCTVVVEMRGSDPAILEWKESAVGA